MRADLVQISRQALRWRFAAQIFPCRVEPTLDPPLQVSDRGVRESRYAILSLSLFLPMPRSRWRVSNQSFVAAMLFRQGHSLSEIGSVRSLPRLLFTSTRCKHPWSTGRRCDVFPMQKVSTFPSISDENKYK